MWMRFAWLRVWPAGGWAAGDCAGAGSIWPLIEGQADGELKSAFSDLPANTSRIRAVRMRRSRWPLGLGDQQMEEEFGLDHHEDRSWRGFHHHACLVMLAYGFLTLERRRARRGRSRPGKRGGSRAPVITLPAIRRALQRLVAPVGRPDCAYGRPWLTHSKTRLVRFFVDRDG